MPGQFEGILDKLQTKLGKQTIKRASTISRPRPKLNVIQIKAINDFVKRNPRADGGSVNGSYEAALRKKIEELMDDGYEFGEAVREAMRQGYQKGGLAFSRGGKKRNPRITEMTEEQRRKQNAQKTFRKKGLGSATMENPKFVEFLKNYKTRDEQTLERGEERAKKNALKNKSMRLEEIVKVEPGKMTFNQRTKLLNSYHKFFEQAYEEAVEAGGLFNRADLSRSVIKKIEEAYPAQIDNMDFFPGRTKNPDHIGYYEYIDREQKGTAKFRKTNNLKKRIGKNISSNFSTKAAGLRQTKQQENIFKLLTEGVNEVDDIASRLGYSRSQVKRETEKLLNNMFVRTNEKPTFLQGKDKLYNQVINALENSTSMGDFHKRNMKSLVYATFPKDQFPKENKLALQRIREFDNFKKKIQKDFPGVKIVYDHPGSYQALKNYDFKNFLNVTPIADDINTLKSRFDLDSIRNLDNLKEAYAAGGANSPEYKQALKKQRNLEKLWSDLTGGKSSLGKIRINRQLTGTTGLEDPTKNLKKEFAKNLEIREQIKKNLTPDLEKRMSDMFPAQKGVTKSIERAKQIAMSDLGIQEQQIIGRLAKLGDCNFQGGRVGLADGTSIRQCVLRGLDKLKKGNLSSAAKINKGAIDKILKTSKGVRALGTVAKWTLGGVAAEAAIGSFLAGADFARGSNTDEIISNFTFGFAGKDMNEQLKDKDPNFGKVDQYISAAEGIASGIDRYDAVGKMGSKRIVDKQFNNLKEAQEPFERPTPQLDEGYFVDTYIMQKQKEKDEEAIKKYNEEKDARGRERFYNPDYDVLSDDLMAAKGGLATLPRKVAKPTNYGIVGTKVYNN